VQDEGGKIIRTLYDGLSFDIIREQETFADGYFTNTSDTGIAWGAVSGGDGSRYRYIGDDAPAAKEQNGYSVTASNRASSRVALYANGQAVGVTRSSNYTSSERSYFGTDLMGTVRTSTTDSGNAEYYEYDVFGKPYGENVSDYAYTGKPYDPTTGMYNYGYRDYVPQSARFSTIDPIRDGSNWFAYCNNEPVNFRDAWGLEAGDPKLSKNNQDNIDKLHPEIRDDVEEMLKNLTKDGINVEITFSYRSYEDQNELYNKGRDEKGNVIDKSKVVTNAKGGQSNHNFGLAFDVEVYDSDGKKTWDKNSDVWKKVIAEGKKQGFDAGAEWEDFPDLPHFENTFGLKPKELRDKVTKNDVTGGYVNVK